MNYHWVIGLLLVIDLRMRLLAIGCLSFFSNTNAVCLIRASYEHAESVWSAVPASIGIAMVVIECGTRREGGDNDDDDDGMDVVPGDDYHAAGKASNVQAEKPGEDSTSARVRVFDMDFFDEESLVIVYQNYAEEGRCFGLNFIVSSV